MESAAEPSPQVNSQKLTFTTNSLRSGMCLPMTCKLKIARPEDLSRGIVGQMPNENGSTEH